MAPRGSRFKAKPPAFASYRKGRLQPLPVAGAKAGAFAYLRPRHLRTARGSRDGALDAFLKTTYIICFSLMKLGLANIFGRQVVLVVVCFLCTFAAPARVTM